MNERKLLLYSSLFLAIISLLVIQIKEPPKRFSLNVENQFSYGNPNASVHMILLEEFACPLCSLFHKETLPIIDKNYVDTGRVKVTIVPLAFLDDSLSSCNLSLCMQKLAPSLMKPFYDFIFTQETLTSPRNLLSLYKEKESSLPSTQILQCLRKSSFDDTIEQNLALAKQIYPGDLHVPIVLINGKLIPNADSKTLSKAIDEVM